MAAAAMSSTRITSSHDLTKFKIQIPIQSFHFTPSISLSIKSTTNKSLHHSFKSPQTNVNHKFPILFAFSGDGGDDDNNGGDGGNGGDGAGKGNGGGGDGNEKEALMVLAEVGRSLESVPADLAAAIRGGRIPGSVVKRYLEIETSPFLKWLMQFAGFKERLLADDLFLAKVAMECGVGMFTKTLAEYEKRKENFSKELEIVFADVVMAVIADFMLVYLPAPTVSLRPPISLNAGRIAKFFYNCPDNAFQTALSGTSYTLLQRLGAIARNGTKLFAVGTASSLVGTVMTNTLINAKKAVQKSSDDELENIPVLATSVGYGVYMAISSNLRYQLLAGVIEQRLLEPLLHQHKLMLSAACFIVRTGNTYLGSLLWVDYARLVGLQKAHDVAEITS
ncbi:hypothetical protein QVD17_11709 [Tagetes erecta]|uniref:Protein RETICULATA-RELATED 4, chloroplastic n=1 Tax=Tagetes erecta TaxID=13708 RepID=A0AAD8KTZ1_TARER|nr:hypothetical protein QVD17_11709 [Tagetes erecta]